MFLLNRKLYEVDNRPRVKETDKIILACRTRRKKCKGRTHLSKNGIILKMTEHKCIDEPKVIQNCLLKSDLREAIKVKKTAKAITQELTTK